MTGTLLEMSPNFRHLKHMCLNLRYLSGLALPSSEVCYTDTTQRKNQLPKDKYPHMRGIITRVHVKLEIVLVFLSVLQFTMVKKEMALLGLCRELSEKLRIEPTF